MRKTCIPAAGNALKSNVAARFASALTCCRVTTYRFEEISRRVMLGHFENTSANRRKKDGAYIFRWLPTRYDLPRGCHMNRVALWRISVGVLLFGSCRPGSTIPEADIRAAYGRYVQA